MIDLVMQMADLQFGLEVDSVVLFGAYPVLLLLAIAFFTPVLSRPAWAIGPLLAPPAPIVGNITFTGSVTLDATTVNTATMVTSWRGLALGGKPQVQTRDGDFATFVTPGDATTFQAPWSFNSGAIPSFWVVDGFTFDLTTSAIAFQGQGSLIVGGGGMVSGNGFASTPGTWNFTTQDGSSSSRFSFSASTAAVPEASTVALLLMGSVGMAGARFLRKSNRATRLQH